MQKLIQRVSQTSDLHNAIEARDVLQEEVLELQDTQDTLRTNAPRTLCKLSLCSQPEELSYTTK